MTFPNPFIPTTLIGFDLPKDARVILRIYDVLGREVITLIDDEQYVPGTHEIEFDASGLASGVYFYRIDAASDGKRFVDVKKMALYGNSSPFVQVFDLSL